MPHKLFINIAKFTPIVGFVFTLKKHNDWYEKHLWFLGYQMIIGTGLACILPSITIWLTKL